MKEEVDPCDDFYEFACGNFIKNTIIPNDEIYVSTASLIEKRIQEQLINELENHKNPYKLKTFKKLKIYYDNCINDSKCNSLLQFFIIKISIGRVVRLWYF